MPVSIVVAEHLPRSAAVLTRLLEAEGYAVTTVVSASEALAVCQERTVDLVVSRVAFADSLNGVDLAHNLEGSGTFVILFSPFPADLLKERVPGLSTTTALHVDTRSGLSELVEAVRAIAAFRANQASFDRSIQDQLHRHTRLDGHRVG